MISEFNDPVKKGDNIFCKKVYMILKRKGINFATGIPCGVQKDIIFHLSHDPDIYHIPAVRESEAIGIAAGAHLAGKKPIIYMQNSGLFNCSNDIASLLIIYKIPVFLSVTWRGCHGEDAPQHLVTGRSTMSLLESIEVPYEILEKDNINQAISGLFEIMEEKQVPVAILIRRGWYK